VSEIPENLARLIGPRKLDRSPVPRHLGWITDAEGRIGLTKLSPTLLALPELSEGPPGAPICSYTDEGGRVEFRVSEIHRADEDTPDPDLTWLTRREVLAQYVDGEVMVDPATRHALAPDGAGGESVAAGVRTFAVQSPTLPPATHTNCHLLESRTGSTHDDTHPLTEGTPATRGLVVDPASTSPSGHAELAERIDRWIGSVGPIEAIVLTHHHADHIGGAEALRERFGAPIWAHPATADRVPFAVDRLLNDGDYAGDWEVLFTPGHAPGHICLWNAPRRLAVVGDMVASVGTIIVEPRDGDMAAYLSSLRRLLALDARVLYPAHGAPVTKATEKLNHYIAHRLWREAAVLKALDDEPASLAVVRARAYPEIDPKISWLADQSTHAHLIKLEQELRARHVGGLWTRV
jgi:glyoxylase-like metal-dependent hydrolase (beta-lactamase superfamily II)